MRVLVFGYGSMGQRHIRNARALGHDVVVYDQRVPDPALVDSDVGVALDADAVWKWHPDAVVVAAPARAHAALLWRALPRPTLVEKPLALSVEDFSLRRPSDGGLVDMDGWLRETDHGVAQVGCNWRFHPLVCEMRRQLIDRAAIPVEAVLWVLADHRGRDYEDALLECGAHEIDLALYLFGPATVTAAHRRGRAWRVELRHENGCSTRIVMDDASENPSRGLRVRWHGADGGNWDGGYNAPHDARASVDVETSYARELRTFLDVASGVAPPDYGADAATLADGLAVLRVVDAARRVVVEWPS